MKPKIIDRIYNPKDIKFTTVDHEIIECTIKVNGRDFSGCSFIHPDDINFFSTKFGNRLAKYRAQEVAMDYYYNEYNTLAKMSRKFFSDVVQGQKLVSIDPTFKFANQCNRYEHYAENLKAERDILRKAINETIKSQDRMIRTVSKFRGKQDD